MNHTIFRANALLLLTALIWGFAFVAQRIGMDFIGPMLFNGIRFSIGVLSLLPLYWFRRNALRTLDKGTMPKFGGTGHRVSKQDPDRRRLLFVSVIAGLLLFAGSSFQQWGIVYTTAGNAGFITGLYIILVPMFGYFWGQKTGVSAWIGALIALVGLYFLSVGQGFRIGLGDGLELIGAIFWALHVHIVGHMARRFDILKVSIIQYLVVAILSLTTGLLTEPFEPAAIRLALPAILYGGVMSVGVAYTLQMLGQRHALASHAAIILSLEGAFAALGGMLVLGERLGVRGSIGAFLMLLGMLVSQLPQLIGQKHRKLIADEQGASS